MVDLTRPPDGQPGTVRGRGWILLLVTVLGWVSLISLVAVPANLAGWLLG